MQVFVWILLLFSIFTPFNFSFIQCFDSTALYHSNSMLYIVWSLLISVSQNILSYTCSDCSKEKKLTQYFHANTLFCDELKWLWNYNTRVRPICISCYPDLQNRPFSFFVIINILFGWLRFIYSHVFDAFCYQIYATGLGMLTKLYPLNEDRNLRNVFILQQVLSLGLTIDFLPVLIGNSNFSEF